MIVPPAWTAMAPSNVASDVSVIASISLTVRSPTAVTSMVAESAAVLRVTPVAAVAVTTPVLTVPSVWLIAPSVAVRPTEVPAVRLPLAIVMSPVVEVRVMLSSAVTPPSVIRTSPLTASNLTSPPVLSTETTASSTTAMSPESATTEISVSPVMGPLTVMPWPYINARSVKVLSPICTSASLAPFLMTTSPTVAFDVFSSTSVSAGTRVSVPVSTPPIVYSPSLFVLPLT